MTSFNVIIITSFIVESSKLKNFMFSKYRIRRSQCLVHSLGICFVINLNTYSAMASKFLGARPGTAKFYSPDHMIIIMSSCEGFDSLSSVIYFEQCALKLFLPQLEKFGYHESLLYLPQSNLVFEKDVTQ